MTYVRLALFWIVGVPLMLCALVFTVAGFLIFTPFLILMDWLVDGEVQDLRIMVEYPLSPLMAFWSMQSEILAPKAD